MAFEADCGVSTVLVAPCVASTTRFPAPAKFRSHHRDTESRNRTEMGFRLFLCASLCSSVSLWFSGTRRFGVAGRATAPHTVPSG